MATSLQSKATPQTGARPSSQTGSGIKRLLLLGQSGFIGAHVSRFVEKHLPDVELIGRSAPEFDLTLQRDVEQLTDLLDPRTAVLMLAGVKRQLGDTLETFLQNVQMAVNVCRILQDNPVRRVVFFSSAAVYGEEINNTSITEHTPVQPTSLYGAAKYASECLFQKVTAPSDPGTLLILRPPVIYGPGDMGNAYGPSGFVEAAAKGQTITIWGDGTERREFIFVEDAAEIACRLTFGDYAGIVNLASGTSYTFLNVLSAVTQALGKETATMSRPRSKPKVDHGFDNSRVTTLLPDFEFTPLDEGIRRLVAARG